MYSTPSVYIKRGLHVSKEIIRAIAVCCAGMYSNRHHAFLEGNCHQCSVKQKGIPSGNKSHAPLRKPRYLNVLQRNFVEV